MEQTRLEFEHGSPISYPLHHDAEVEIYEAEYTDHVTQSDKGDASQIDVHDMMAGLDKTP